ncbi:MAG TPA: AbrB/MazE/SpoVT family DNA-binding domain-containing protein [Noviherbaspirillum sp.]|uniref:AbrB/MazE/SpoVT family DNA-binding domain-containing protein n=1 Tax=Noviherbaspirillum sp. TaxID=1926288 RepID=UPI002D5D9BFB|nr:AbrB/MazE/SpoVT family DNA-binding domain-containing protein [Noviherbaspirillum sp.]HYD97321.1 AbrB/MazE/SpoVT family DNA-binding domain-containing protein [Noviherbaspirillum sp.]
MHALKLVPFDREVGVVLPREVLAKLGCGTGGTLYLTETADGLLLSSQHPVIQEQIDAGRAFIDDYRDALRALSE